MYNSLSETKQHVCAYWHLYDTNAGFLDWLMMCGEVTQGFIIRCILFLPDVTDAMGSSYLPMLDVSHIC